MTEGLARSVHVRLVRHAHNLGVDGGGGAGGEHEGTVPDCCGPYCAVAWSSSSFGIYSVQGAMGTKTGIEWTDATWNPVTGCTRVSAGCDNCYAATLANRLLRTTYLKQPPVVRTSENEVDPFALRIWADRLDEPSRWAEPRRVFVNSMSDLFHRDIPEPFLRKVFQVMLKHDRHIYQVLTKRPTRAARFHDGHRELFGGEAVPPHIWIGTSVESQEVDYRVRHLRQVPASVRFLSCEPLLGPVELDLSGIDWVIAGGESGPVRRAMDLDWARSLRDQCLEQGVPFFFKQVGGRTPKAGGRELDGRTWNEWPVPEGVGEAAHALG